MTELSETMWLLGAASGALVVGSIWLCVETMRLRKSIKRTLRNENLE